MLHFKEFHAVMHISVYFHLVGYLFFLTSFIFELRYFVLSFFTQSLEKTQILK